MSAYAILSVKTHENDHTLRSSYVEDPIWQRRFTAIWAGCLGLALVLSSPALYRAYLAGRVFPGLFGVREGIREWGYIPAPTIPPKKAVLAKKHRQPLGTPIPFVSFLVWSPLGVGLNVGQSTSSESRLLPVILTFTVPSYRCGALLCHHHRLHLDARTSH